MKLEAGEIIIAPSILTADFAVLGEEIRSLDPFMDWLHLDVMDGVFVPNMSFAFPVVKAARRLTEKPLDAHLMITHPEKYAGKFAEAGADYVTVHPEADGNIAQALKDIRSAGGKPGLAIKPDTPSSAITPFIDIGLELLLVMSVEPGFGGQKFRDYVLPKFTELRSLVGDDCVLEIDGGINPNTVGPAAAAGCQAFVVGTTLLNPPPEERGLVAGVLRSNAGKAVKGI